jgi:hypothetical protein
MGSDKDSGEHLLRLTRLDTRPGFSFNTQKNPMSCALLLFLFYR